MTNSLEDRCKKLISLGNFDQCEKEIVNAMTAEPHSAICHNLMGILMENENEHVLAMKHFRAAYALDSTYIPARLNMELFGQDYPLKHLVYSEDDCSK